MAIRLLIDNALPPVFAAWLRGDRIDAIHLREICSPEVTDRVVIDHAVEENRIVVSLDTDFGFLLAERRSKKPSIILFRGATKKPRILFERLKAHLPDIETDLDRGAVVVFTDDRLRIRPLPIASTG